MFTLCMLSLTELAQVFLYQFLDGLEHSVDFTLLCILHECTTIHFIACPSSFKGKRKTFFPLATVLLSYGK